MKYLEWLNIWLENYVKPTHKIRTFDLYRQMVEKKIVPYKALYEEVDHGGILQQLYDDFISSENASVSTGEDTIFFIKDYCEHYHSDVMKEFIGEENFAYFGTDEEDKAYYYFKDGLGVDNLNRIKEQADEYIIVAPVLYMSQESLEDKNITFLKLGNKNLNALAKLLYIFLL